MSWKFNIYLFLFDPEICKTILSNFLRRLYTPCTFLFRCLPSVASRQAFVFCSPVYFRGRPRSLLGVRSAFFFSVHVDKHSEILKLKSLKNLIVPYFFRPFERSSTRSYFRSFYFGVFGLLHGPTSGSYRATLNTSAFPMSKPCYVCCVNISFLLLKACLTRDILVFGLLPEYVKSLPVSLPTNEPKRLIRHASVSSISMT